MVKVLDDAFGVEAGLMTTVHAYTNDQNLLDLAHKDLRRSRAAAINIVPTATGAARATSLVLERHEGQVGRHVAARADSGRLDHRLHGRGARPPAWRRSTRPFARRPAADRSSAVLVYTDEPIVSSDIVGSPASCTFDSLMTMVQRLDDARSLVKVFGWYDNEWGYSSRLVDLAHYVSR